MDQGTFQLGEVAIFRNVPVPFNFLNGSECEIVGPLKNRFVIDLRGQPGLMRSYEVLFNGLKCAVPPEQLKKRPPKADSKDADFGKTVEWGDCAWSPEKEAA